MNILANDGLEISGISALESYGFSVFTEKVPQENLIDFINENSVEVLLVRSATQVPKELINACKRLKIIGRGGVGMDNIAVEYAREKGLHIINTPEASSHAVAELVFAHLLSCCRFLQYSNREMPKKGNANFNSLKKSYSKGIELKDKTLGIIGLGRIGKEIAKIGFGLGMRVISHDINTENEIVKLEFFNRQFIDFEIVKVDLDEILKTSDFVILQVPKTEKPLIGKENFEKMKNGAGIINCARGGIIDEGALLDALESGKISFAGLDVFEGEPSPSEKILNHPKISLSPHTGASTQEAQERIGISLAEQIAEIYGLIK